jgi:hypothetical protein
MPCKFVPCPVSGYRGVVLIGYTGVNLKGYRIIP